MAAARESLVLTMSLMKQSKNAIMRDDTFNSRISPSALISLSEMDARCSARLQTLQFGIKRDQNKVLYRKVEFPSQKNISLFESAREDNIKIYFV